MAVAGDNCFVQYRRTQVSGVRLSYIAVTVRTLIPLFSFLFLFVSPAGMDATMSIYWVRETLTATISSPPLLRPYLPSFRNFDIRISA